MLKLMVQMHQAQVSTSEAVDLDAISNYFRSDFIPSLKSWHTMPSEIYSRIDWAIRSDVNRIRVLARKYFGFLALDPRDSHRLPDFTQ